MGVLDCRNIGGCQSKIFTSRHDNSEETAEAGNTITIRQDNPLYAVPALDVDEGDGGEQYSNKPLALFTSHGTDTSLWNCFIWRFGLFGGDAAEPITIEQYTLGKVNITFTGVRWSSRNLFTGPTNDRFAPDPLMLNRPLPINEPREVRKSNKENNPFTVHDDLRDTLRLLSTKLSTLSRIIESGQSKEHIGVRWRNERHYGTRGCLVPPTETIPWIDDGGLEALDAILDEQGPELHPDWDTESLDRQSPRQSSGIKPKHNTPNITAIEIFDNTGHDQGRYERITDSATISEYVILCDEDDEIQTPPST